MFCDQPARPVEHATSSIAVFGDTGAKPASGGRVTVEANAIIAAATLSLARTELNGAFGE
jgi:hypothetical protein